MKLKSLIAIVISLSLALAANDSPRSQGFGGGGGSSGSGLLHVVALDSLDISLATSPVWSPLVTTTLGSTGWASKAYMTVQCIRCWGIGNNAKLKIIPYGFPAATTESQRDDGADTRMRLLIQNVNAANASPSGLELLGVIQIADSTGAAWVTGKSMDDLYGGAILPLPPQMALRISNSGGGNYATNARLLVTLYFLK